MGTRCSRLLWSLALLAVALAAGQGPARVGAAAPAALVCPPPKVKAVWLPLLATPAAPGAVSGPDAGPAQAAGPVFYVAPQGSPAGDGSSARPWDLATVLARADRVPPGATVIVRGGVYRGLFTSNLRGTAARPIVVRAARGERATLDGGAGQGAVLLVNGPHVWFWGLEITSSAPGRVIGEGGSAPESLRRPYGVVSGQLDDGPRGVRFINMVVHDVSQGFSLWDEAVDSEVYGSIIYNNGWQGPDRGHGHGIYSQNNAGTKRLADNVIFQQFGYGIHIYGSSRATLRGYTVEGNVFFNSGTISRDLENPNLLVGGETRVEDVRVVGNFVFNNGRQGTNLRFGYEDYRNGDITVTDNYVVGGDVTAAVQNWEAMVFARNTLVGAQGLVWLLPTVAVDRQAYRWDDNRYFATARQVPFVFQREGALDLGEWRRATGFDQRSTLTGGAPTQSQVFVRPNQYEPGRATVVVYNWAGAATASIDASDLLCPGQRYEVRDAQAFFGPPVAQGTFDGRPVALPLAGVAPALPVGEVPTVPPRTGPLFHTFILLPLP